MRTIEIETQDRFGKRRQLLKLEVPDECLSATFNELEKLVGSVVLGLKVQASTEELKSEWRAAVVDEKTILGFKEWCDHPGGQ